MKTKDLCDDLKPCPFCGYDIQNIEGQYSISTGKEVNITCQGDNGNCEANITLDETEMLTMGLNDLTRAITIKWNRRR